MTNVGEEACHVSEGTGCQGISSGSWRGKKVLEEKVCLSLMTDTCENTSGCSVKQIVSTALDKPGQVPEAALKGRVVLFLLIKCLKLAKGG